jgi:NADPH:quinone reductase-like Zn-dependent oxidoreductase
MLAAYAARFSPDDPLSALEVADRPEPEPPVGAAGHWTTVDVRAAGINQHDLWSLRGVGLRAEQLPMTLGTDAAGVTPDGREVVVHGVIWGDGVGERAVGVADRRSLLSERYPGTLAERVAVPTGNLVPKPAELSSEDAACLPTAWLTAYSMLFRGARVTPGDRVLVQGAGGGVATAAIALGAAAGLEVWATSRSEHKRAEALRLGAAGSFEHGARLPARVDAVIETVGRATWSHSVRSLRPGGTVVVAGATSGDPDAAELQRIFFTELRVQGVTMGTRDDLASLLAFLVRTGVRPTIDSTFPLARAADALGRLASGEHVGKVVVTV